MYIVRRVNITINGCHVSGMRKSAMITSQSNCRDTFYSIQMYIYLVITKLQNNNNNLLSTHTHRHRHKHRQTDTHT